MTDYADPQRSSERLSDTEREAAVQQLAAARSEGRLRPEEFDQRAVSARAAVTRGDLASLFADLPAPSSAYGAAPTAAPSAAPMYSTAPSSFDGDVSGSNGSRRALGGAVGATIMALIPFAALALFFITSYAVGWGWSWLWFLIIPVAGIIIYGPGSDSRGRGR
jgi:hypothetical protein